DIIDYDPEIMHIFSRDVLKKIQHGESGWEKMLPKGVPDMIKEKKLFTIQEGNVEKEKVT
ncbi:MAG: TonB-dependent receptor, partial [Flavobacteriaceae bacterium]